MMTTKTILALAFLGALGAQAAVAGAPAAEKKSGVVIVEQLEAYPATEEDAACAYLVTPSATTQLRGGNNC